VAVSYGYGETNLLRDADFIIDGMRELPSRLDELNGF
jgi:hypothetical protein